jgi:Na+/H+-dicarboxylate symporter
MTVIPTIPAAGMALILGIDRFMRSPPWSCREGKRN